MSVSAKPLMSPERRHRDRRAGLATAALRRALTMPGWTHRQISGGVFGGEGETTHSPRARRQLAARRAQRLSRRRRTEVSGGILAIVLLAFGLLPACAAWPL